MMLAMSIYDAEDLAMKMEIGWMDVHDRRESKINSEA